MRRLTVLAAILMVAIPAAAVDFVIVETFTATSTWNINMPGTPAGGDIDFTGGGSISSLDFAPGSVTFRGMPVDFDGTEADFISSTYTGTGSVPNLPSNPVTVPGNFATGGTLGPMAGGSEWTGLELGPAFSENNFDLAGLPYDARDHVLWSSAVVPELDGHLLRIETSNSITFHNPVTGELQISTNGVILALDTPVVPATSTWGLVLLAVGLLVGTTAAIKRQTRSAS